jgi:GNAT superfamily N-acetyltransferase
VSIEITPVDPADEDAIREFYAVYRACGRHDWASFTPMPPQQLRQVIRQPTEIFRYTAFLARDGETVVGQGWYAAYRRANRNKAIGTPRVLPEHRRRGAGSAVLARLEEQARADGRSILQASPRWGTEYGSDGAGSAGVEFARRHGYPVLLVEARRRLALPVSPGLLDQLRAKAGPAYEIRVFSGPVPDDLVQGWAELEASLPTEAPLGQMEQEARPPSAAAVRAGERLLAGTGQVRYSAVAVTPDGAVAGYTDITVASGQELAEQGGTLVQRAHRGHGLGYGLKAAVIGLLQRERPDVTATVTSNALSNAAMVAVNDRLGYQVDEYVGDVQKRLQLSRSSG